MRQFRWFVLMLVVAMVGLIPVGTASADRGPERGRGGFRGVIESLPNTTGWVGDWTVGGRVVHVTAETRINQEHGAVAVGAMVEIRGERQDDGSINTVRIQVQRARDGERPRPAELHGVIETLPNTQGWIGDWTVGGRKVHVTAETRIDQEHGAVAVGARVEVKGRPETDGSITALMIEVER